jgi:hypothetical protein
MGMSVVFVSVGSITQLPWFTLFEMRVSVNMSAAVDWVVAFATKTIGKTSSPAPSVTREVMLNIPESSTNVPLI